MTVPRQPNKLKVPVTKGSIGLFISPEGELVEVRQSHINTVILHPARFGKTTQEIQSIYAQHKERVGIEGVAREEILREIISRGWIRLRRYVHPQEKWSATVNKLDPRSRVLLQEWAEEMLNGTLGFREDDPYKPVVITALTSGDVQSHTVEALARGCFLSSNQL